MPRNVYRSQPPIYSDEEAQSWWASKVPLPMADPGRPRGIFPTSDPRKSSWYSGGGMPRVQSLEGATVQATLNGSAEVHGEIQGTWIVQAGSELISIVENVKRIAVQVQGKLEALGSNG